MKQIRRRLTYANVMSTIAVFLVLGGGAALAASVLPKNSVGSRELKPNAVKTGIIARNAVRTGKVAAEAIRAGKLAQDAVPTNRIRDLAVATDKLAEGAVTRSKLAEGGLLPRAYAFVDFNGVVDPNISVNVPNATNPATGVYCFDLGFEPVQGQATVQSDAEGNDFASLNVLLTGDPLEGCPAGTDVQVETWDAGTEARTSEEFFLVLW